MHSFGVRGVFVGFFISQVICSSTNSSKNACAEVSRLSRESNKDGTDVMQVDGPTALACLKSMPFKANRASQFVTELKKYFQWQSTIDMLSDPPESYLYPGVDIQGTLDQIVAKASSNAYSNHYDFDEDIAQLVTATHDGHVSLGLCSRSIFEFELNESVISASVDGIEVPELYVYSDIEALIANSSHVSPLATINGFNASAYLGNISSALNFQDPDAFYNAAVTTIPLNNIATGLSMGAFAKPLDFYPGSNISFTFTNGSTSVISSFANVPISFNYTTGQELFEAFCVPSKTTNGRGSSSPSSTPTGLTPTSTAVSGYPLPVAHDRLTNVAFYYLNETDVEDVVVMQVRTFEILDREVKSFVDTVLEFLSSVDDAKRRLVIDLSGNPGGDAELGFFLFHVFFHKKLLYSATRFRAIDAIDAIGSALSTIDPNGQSDNPLLDDLNAKAAVAPGQQKGFASWLQLYGPKTVDGASFSSLYAVANLSDALMLSNITQAPFKTENIILLTDGLCTSTCTIFAELMKHLAGVRSIVFGGRPQQGPMQALGGSKGAQDLKFEAIDQHVQAAVNLSRTLTPQQLQTLNQSAPIGLDNLPLVLRSGSINFRNSYGQNDNSTPLQFVYEAADCRLFYTAENILQPATVWTAAARAMWGDGRCVPGSTGANGSLSGSGPGSANWTVSNGKDHGGGDGGGVTLPNPSPSASSLAPSPSPTGAAAPGPRCSSLLAAVMLSVFLLIFNV